MKSFITCLKTITHIQRDRENKGKLDVMDACNPTVLERWRQEDQFKVILSCIANSQPWLCKNPFKTNKPRN